MVIRVEKTNNYTVMSNHHLRDKNLSLKAKGLLSFMLSLPDEWDYTEKGLASCLKEGRDGVSATLKELSAHGYLVRRQVRNANGTMGGAEYVVYENPITEEPITEKPTSAKPISEKTAQIKTKVIKKEKVSTERTNTKAASGCEECSPALAEALRDFEEHRKKLRKPMTEKAKSLLLKKLARLSDNEDEQIAILNQSIENGWQGIFPIGGDRGKNNARRETAKEEADRLIQEMQEEGIINDSEGESGDNSDIDSLSAWLPKQQG